MPTRLVRLVARLHRGEPDSLKVAEAPRKRGRRRPHWDACRHELVYAGQMVKAFRQPSPNQECILAVFEEEGWPSQIDDPLVPVKGIEPRGRLRDAINNLNLHQVRRLLVFRGDGSGRGVLWEPLDNPAPSSELP